MNNRKILIGGAVVLLGVFIWVGLSGRKTQEAVEVTPEQEVTAQELYTQAAALIEDGDVVKTKEAYQKILTEYSDYEHVESVQKELEALNLKIIFSNTPTSQTVMHDVVSGDTLGKLAKKYNTTIELIKINNNLKNNIIRIGRKLRIWTGTFNIYVDKSQNILILKDGEEVVKVYNVSTGENNITPVGTFKVSTKLKDPVWFNRGIVVPPESPSNVLGSRWLGFNIPGYGIHGTVEPETIGQQVTAGCVRMHNEQVEELYSLVPMGTEVVIVD